MTKAVRESGQGREGSRAAGDCGSTFSAAPPCRRFCRVPAHPHAAKYRGDFQMHSVWSDGAETLESIVEACLARGYRCAGITDHSYGLPIAGGMTMAQAIAAACGRSTD